MQDLDQRSNLFAKVGVPIMYRQYSENTGPSIITDEDTKFGGFFYGEGGSHQILNVIKVQTVSPKRPKPRPCLVGDGESLNYRARAIRGITQSDYSADYISKKAQDTLSCQHRQENEKRLPTPNFQRSPSHWVFPDGDRLVL